MKRPLAKYRPLGPFIKLTDSRTKEEKLLDEVEDVGNAMELEDEVIRTAKDIAADYAPDSSLSDDNYIDPSVGLNTIPLMSIYVAQLKHQASGNNDKERVSTAHFIEAAKDNLDV